MVDLLCVVAGSVPAGGCELSVRARQRGGRPHSPNRGGTGEFGQRNLGVSRASKSVEAHQRLRGRTAPGLVEGSPGAGVAGESVIARHPTPLASPGTGGPVATWNVAVVSHGSPLVVVMAPIENKPIRGEFGHRFSRSSAWRVDGHAPPPEEHGVRGRKSTKDLRGRWVRVLGGQGSVRASLPMNRQLRADRRQTFSDRLRLTTTGPGRHGVNGRCIGGSFSSWVPTTGRQRAKGPV
jgi:hypothetical protein